MQACGGVEEGESARSLARVSASDGSPKGRDAASEASGGTRLGAEHESAATPEVAGARKNDMLWTEYAALVASLYRGSWSASRPMRKGQSERNAAVIRERKGGKSYAVLAEEFGISRDRARQIVELARREENRRAALVAKYGERPDIRALPDDTPIDVLELCDGDMHGWAARIRHLKNSHENPLATLGDVRRTTDAQLRKEPNVGRKMIAELRRFCPFRDTASDAAEAVRHLRRALLAIGKLETELSAARAYVRLFPDTPSLHEAREELTKAIALIEGMRR